MSHSCRHCGTATVIESEFCCRGCEGAHALIQGLGLDSYYRRRTIDPKIRALKPDEDRTEEDFPAHVFDDPITGEHQLHLMVEGIHCAACVWLIESILGRDQRITQARINMTTRRLVLRWSGGSQPAQLLEPVLKLGYRLVPFDPRRLKDETRAYERELLRAMAVAGFAAGNVMLFSVSVWAGSDMGPATRTFMHWLSALVALPAIAWCIRPFARSAWSAIRARRSNMDVPITIGVTLATAMSLFETITWGEHAYFDSAVMLLFFLLIGRYLDSRARGQARLAAERLLTLDAGAVTVLGPDGTRHRLAPEKVSLGQTVLVAAGEKIGVDGVIASGRSDVDASLISGETLPVTVSPGSKVFAGTVNLSAPLTMVVDAVGERTLLAEIVRMMEAAEQGRSRFVALADRVARWYAPVVHVAALATFLGWILGMGIAWQPALLNAVAVLIITCPCALALAVPAVQVIGSGRLMRQGILIKSATALERFAAIDTVVFDKTGTLTEGRPRLMEPSAIDPFAWGLEDLELAASLAGASHHPLARAIAARCPGALPPEGIEEIPGSGLCLGDIRLGSRAHAGVNDLGDSPVGPEIWLARQGRTAVRFTFTDAVRPDLPEVLERLKAMGLSVELLSGDRPEVVEAVARVAGVATWRAGCTPADKVARLERLRGEGRKVLMVGDGLNDAPALAAASVSMSPAAAADVSRTVADVVFQGEKLSPVAETVAIARFSSRLVRQNIALAIGYNVLVVPLAVAGLVTPLIAAIAMSTSSLVVIANALRLSRGRA